MPTLIALVKYETLESEFYDVTIQLVTDSRSVALEALKKDLYEYYDELLVDEDFKKEYRFSDDVVYRMIELKTFSLPLAIRIRKDIIDGKPHYNEIGQVFKCLTEKEVDDHIIKDSKLSKNTNFRYLFKAPHYSHFWLEATRHRIEYYIQFEVVRIIRTPINLLMWRKAVEQTARRAGLQRKSVIVSP